jgi:hypothetical protein
MWWIVNGYEDTIWGQTTTYDRACSRTITMQGVINQTLIPHNHHFTNWGFIPGYSIQTTKMCFEHGNNHSTSASN